jgi:DNA-binding NarL/FixJ family response regulator
MNATVKPEPLHGADGRHVRKRVLLVDDHAVVRKGLSAMIAEEPDLMVCGEAETAPHALEAMRRLEPDVALLDISMPGTNGIELIKAMLAERPKLPILMLSVHDESLYALRALRAGAKGYLMKSEAVPEIFAALRKVLAGETYVSPRLGERLVFQAIQSQNGSLLGSPVDKLSDRELEVLHHLGKGHGTREIAVTLNLSVKTVETHRAHIKEKLGVKDSAEMVRFALDWVALEER